MAEQGTKGIFGFAKGIRNAPNMTPIGTLVLGGGLAWVAWSLFFNRPRTHGRAPDGEDPLHWRSEPLVRPARPLKERVENAVENVPVPRQQTVPASQQRGTTAPAGATAAYIVGDRGMQVQSEEESPVRRAEATARAALLTAKDKAEYEVGKVADKAHRGLERGSRALRYSVTDSSAPSLAELEGADVVEPVAPIPASKAQVQSLSPVPAPGTTGSAVWQEAVEMLFKDAQRHADFLQNELDTMSSRLPWKYGQGPRAQTGSLSLDEAWKELVDGLDDAKEHASFIAEQLEALKEGRELVLAPRSLQGRETYRVPAGGKGGELK